MQRTTSSQRRAGRARAAMVFLLHQLIATLGVLVTAPFAFVAFADFSRLFGSNLSLRDVHRVLTQTPYFPVQIALALLLGWLLGRFLAHRSMLWVWVLPLAVLGCALVAFSSTGQLLLHQYARLSSPSLLPHFFGWGCQNLCLDQLLITMPFYSAGAYSLGAWLARRIGPPSSFAPRWKARGAAGCRIRRDTMILPITGSRSPR